jgi:hypothetical protein
VSWRKKGSSFLPERLPIKIDAKVLEERLNAFAITAQNFDKIGFQMDKISALAGLQRSG